MSCLRWLAALALSGTSAVASANSPDLLEEGRAVYNFRCYFCHGYSGNARTLAASFLTPPPADFTQADPNRLTEALIAQTVRDGRTGTGMKSFADVLPENQILAVSRFVHEEFVLRKAINTRYHTKENGWPDHDRYAIAFPYATGEIPLSRRWEDLTPEQARGKRLYLTSCVSCHDRGTHIEHDITWDSRPLSYPRKHFSLSEVNPAIKLDVDAVAQASPYAKHDKAPVVAGLLGRERQGEILFQKNCAFCHGGDGTGKNWIGQFLEPHPRNLQDPAFMAGKTREQLVVAISEGLPGTSMPAWKTLLGKRDIQAIVDYIARAFHPLPPWQARRSNRSRR